MFYLVAFFPVLSMTASRVRHYAFIILNLNPTVSHRHRDRTVSTVIDYSVLFNIFVTIFVGEGVRLQLGTCALLKRRSTISVRQAAN